MNDTNETIATDAFRSVLKLLRYLRQHARQMNSQGISPQHFSVLRFLLESGPVTVGQVQDYLYQSASTASTLVAQLEEAGHVTRTRSKKDNRVVIVELTVVGQEIAQNTSLAGLPLLRRQLKHLPQERLQTINEVLAELMQLMEVPDSQ